MYDHSNEDIGNEFEQLAKPLIKFINDYYHPHAMIIITPDSADILSGEMSIYTEEYIKD